MPTVGYIGKSTGFFTDDFHSGGLGAFLVFENYAHTFYPIPLVTYEFVPFLGTSIEYLYKVRVTKSINTPEMQALNHWLRKAREGQGLSMRELGRRLDVPHSFIQKVELGERRLDVVEYLWYCKALEVSPHEGIELIVGRSGHNAVLMDQWVAPAGGRQERVVPDVLPIVRRMLDALPFAVSWALMPGARIQYSNRAFHQLFGYPLGYFQTAAQLVDEACIHEQQRELLRQRWGDFTLPPNTTGVTTVPDAEVDILSGDGQIRTVQHCGLILHEQRAAVAIYKDISEFKRDNRVLREYAFLDPLTGVANRRGLQERWRDETRGDRQRRFAFLMVDLDGFKPINDRLGHDAGDAVLCVVASRLKAAVRDVDLVCRLGGDEFGLLLTTAEDLGQIEVVCQRIIMSLSEPMEVNGSIVRITASVGGCLYPDEASDKRELLQRADRALYRIKKSGKGGWGWWHPKLLTG